MSTATSVMWQPWLPDNTVIPKRAQSALTDMVDGWSHAWFSGEAMRSAGTLVRIDTRSELRNAQWHVHDEGLTIGLSSSGLPALGAQVLGIPAINRSAADLALLDTVGVACLDDLKRRSASLFGVPETAWSIADARKTGSAHRLEITGPARNPVLTLELSADLFVALVKAKLPPVPRSAPLGHPGEAISTLPVCLTALLGHAAITIAELSDLVKGDVLILDRALDVPLPLVIEGKRVARGTCSVSEVGTELKIIEAPIG